MTQITRLAAFLQSLFTDVAGEVGRLTELVRRQRDLTAADFAQTLVFGWIDQPDAPLDSFAVRLDLSAGALHQRMNERAQAFFKQLIARALRHVQQARPETLRLLRPFPAVVVEDSTIVRLPGDAAGRYRGHGGTGSPAAMKVLVRWELLPGQLLSIEVVPSVTDDRGLGATAGDLPAGALHLADQGFFDSDRWSGFDADGKDRRYWISRVPARIGVCSGDRWQSLGDLLAGLPGDVREWDQPVRIVESRPLSCRLTLRRCPPEVAARRRQKLRERTRRKKGREPSGKQLAACDWQTLATNVAAAQLDAQSLWLVYRSRWQIELLFKRCKSQLGWSRSRGRTGDRVVTEVLAKVLGLIVVHWQSLLRGGPLSGVSPVKLFRLVRRRAWQFWDRLQTGRDLEEALRELEAEMRRTRPQPRRTKHPSTRQTLNPKRLAA